MIRNDIMCYDSGNKWHVKSDCALFKIKNNGKSNTNPNNPK